MPTSAGTTLATSVHVFEAAEQQSASLVLPLWTRPRGQGNTTNYLASPLVFASVARGCGNRSPATCCIHRSLLEQLDLHALPDDYGVDISITLTALDAGLGVGQVPLVAPEHPSKEGNSERVMMEVATAVTRHARESPVDGSPRRVLA